MAAAGEVYRICSPLRGGEQWQGGGLLLHG
jgi:hypothetical protein